MRIDYTAKIIIHTDMRIIEMYLFNSYKEETHTTLIMLSKLNTYRQLKPNNTYKRLHLQFTIIHQNDIDLINSKNAH